MNDFGAELQPQAVGQREVAHERHVDVGVAGPARDVPAGVAELPRLRERVETLERRAAEIHSIDGVRPVVRIADEIRTARREAGDRRAVGLQRDVGRVARP